MSIWSKICDLFRGNCVNQEMVCGDNCTCVQSCDGVTQSVVSNGEHESVEPIKWKVGQTVLYRNRSVFEFVNIQFIEESPLIKGSEYRRVNLCTEDGEMYGSIFISDNMLRSSSDVVCGGENMLYALDNVNLSQFSLCIDHQIEKFKKGIQYAEEIISRSYKFNTLCIKRDLDSLIDYIIEEKVHPVHEGELTLHEAEHVKESNSENINHLLDVKQKCIDYINLRDNK